MTPPPTQLPPSVRAATREDLLALLRSLAAEIVPLVEAKNKGYGIHSVFQNFFVIEDFTRGDISTEMGMFVRLMDKITRLYNSIVKGVADLSDERTRDTVLDLWGYSTLLLLRHMEKKSALPPLPSWTPAPVPAHPSEQSAPSPAPKLGYAAQGRYERRKVSAPSPALKLVPLPGDEISFMGPDNRIEHGRLISPVLNQAIALLFWNVRTNDFACIVPRNQFLTHHRTDTPFSSSSWDDLLHKGDRVRFVTTPPGVGSVEGTIKHQIQVGPFAGLWAIEDPLTIVPGSQIVSKILIAPPVPSPPHPPLRDAQQARPDMWDYDSNAIAAVKIGELVCFQHGNKTRQGIIAKQDGPLHFVRDTETNLGYLICEREILCVARPTPPP